MIIQTLYAFYVLLSYMPLLDNRTKFVPGEGHSMEIGQAIFALHLFANQPKFSVIGVRILVQITQRNLINSSFEKVAGDA